jgi:transcriptional regulator with XRE-family HTH domain
MKDSLKVLRVKKKLTQKELAEKIGVTEATISKWERGKSFPDVPKIDKLAEIFGVRYSDINFYDNDTLKACKTFKNKKYAS